MWSIHRLICGSIAFLFLVNSRVQVTCLVLFLYLLVFYCSHIPGSFQSMDIVLLHNKSLVFQLCFSRRSNFGKRKFGLDGHKRQDIRYGIQHYTSNMWKGSKCY